MPRLSSSSCAALTILLWLTNGPFANNFSCPKNILSATGIPAIVPASCTIIHIPFCCASNAEAGAHGFPRYNISPLVAFCIPDAIEETVDLPLPFSPIRPRTSPVFNTKLTWFKATVTPKFLHISLTSKIASPFEAIYFPPSLIIFYTWHTILCNVLSYLSYGHILTCYFFSKIEKFCCKIVKYDIIL